jgi:hypothetical protein
MMIEDESLFIWLSLNSLVLEYNLKHRKNEKKKRLENTTWEKNKNLEKHIDFWNRRIISITIAERRRKKQYPLIKKEKGNTFLDSGELSDDRKEFFVSADNK